jgi:hypothetical protein
MELALPVAGNGRGKRVALLPGFILGLLYLSSCTNAPTAPTAQGDLTDKLEQQQRRIEQLESERRSGQELMRLVDARLERLKAENEQLTKQETLLKNRLEVAAIPVPAPPPVPEVSEVVEPIQAKPTPQPQEIKQLTASQIQEQIVDLEAKIVELRPRLALANARVTNITKATVNSEAEAPSGGFIRGGTIYRRILICQRPQILRSPDHFKEHVHSESCYGSQAIGPSLRRGDFPTAFERDKAAQIAREEASPLKLQMAQLTKALEKAKQELGKLRAAEIQK